ncbi:MBL fold metallo-hydrolase [Hydrogenibacillus sp. N12]|uniref:MBL fold metallo-hydrolase n=1 Tax=Hydrogenibacillus sp. N12 TaxID=2866627 RepID=UPI001C7CF0F8|nr:MBL fold metallo-hydrolase [Hydrogenibacillus sp. N12]QZA32426.1 MBL fold metallo-hydrolase [Hydrogenibacillus sp. N12]
MLLRTFVDEKLAHYSYLVGCQATGEAIVIDPMRNIEPYLETAAREGVRIVGAAETHIHADFVSGARELADRVGATLYLSDEGDENWKYRYLDGLPHRLLKDGDVIQIGNIRLEVLHTPGHTPEHLSFLLYDLPATQKPIGIFTGDFVFVGDVGRPDLLEAAAGLAGTAVPGARQMFQSLKRFKALPDYLQVWPAHGAGSACGKALGAVPSSTVGYEKLTNWALQIDDEDAFVEALLADQPEAPKYFKHMKRINKEGPALLRELKEPVRFGADDETLERLQAEGVQIVDARPQAAFQEGHLPGSINIPLGKSFTTWAGWLVDYDRPLAVVADEAAAEEIRIALRSIGIDRLEGIIAPTDVLARGPEKLDRYANVRPEDVKDRLGDFFILDVRSESERKAGALEGSTHIMLGDLPDRLAEVPKDRPILVHCELGGRSAIAASILRANGYREVYNLLGGYAELKQALGRVDAPLNA